MAGQEQVVPLHFSLIFFTVKLAKFRIFVLSLGKNSRLELACELISFRPTFSKASIERKSDKKKMNARLLLKINLQASWLISGHTNCSFL